MSPSSRTSSTPFPFARRPPAASAVPAAQQLDRVDSGALGDAGEAAVTRGQIRIRPTGFGALAIAFVLACGIVAVNSGNNLLYLVVAAMLAVLALSGLLGHRNLRAAGLRLLPPEEAWAGRPVSVCADLVNHRRRLPAFLLNVSPGRGPSAATAVEIPPGSRGRLSLTLSFPVRGRHPWPDFEVSSEFPFGLIRRGALVRPPGTCLVYPRPIPVPWELIERSEREGDLESRRAAGSSGDYRGLRDYVAGDSVSRIHWKSWLRLRRLHTREYEAEGAPPVLYSFDSVPGPGREERLGQLTWLVRTALRRGRSVGLALPGRTIPPGNGPAHRRELLTALALFGEPG